MQIRKKIVGLLSTFILGAETTDPNWQREWTQHIQSEQKLALARFNADPQTFIATYHWMQRDTEQPTGLTIATRSQKSPWHGGRFNFLDNFRGLTFLRDHIADTGQDWQDDGELLLCGLHGLQAHNGGGQDGSNFEMKEYSFALRDYSLEAFFRKGATGTDHATVGVVPPYGNDGIVWSNYSGSDETAITIGGYVVRDHWPVLPNTVLHVQQIRTNLRATQEARYDTYLNDVLTHTHTEGWTYGAVGPSVIVTGSIADETDPVFTLEQVSIASHKTP